MKNSIIFNKVAIIGLGLIGGSLAKVLREQKLCKEIVGNSRSDHTMQRALELNLVDIIEKNLAKVVVGCDLVVLAMPVSYTRVTLQGIKPGLSKTTIVTDVGSVKGDVQKAANEVLGEYINNFVAGHPIAGSEQSGVESGRSDLFVNHKVILTPTKNTNKSALEKIKQLWLLAGADLVEMDVLEHDRVLAATSHLPHLLAYALVECLAASKDGENIFRYAAGGFKDFTRIASSDPKMWRDIFLSNKKETLKAVDDYVNTLSILRNAINNSDDDFLMGTFTRAKSARDHFVALLNQQTYTQTYSQRRQTVNSMQVQKNITFVVRPAVKIAGTIKVAGDKSISHRSVMLSSLAEGISRISGFLEGEDSLATLQAFRDMGVLIEGPDNGELIVHGVGLRGLKEPPGPLYVGNSGTSMRLLMGLLAGQTFNTELRGDVSLTKRPMERVAKPLRAMGAKIETDDGKAPIKITGQGRLKGIDCKMEVVSAQVKSAVLLAGLYSEGDVTVTELNITRDHSERMLRGFGCKLESNDLMAKFPAGVKQLKAQNIEVPADISSAAFFMVAASISEGSDITITHVGINPTRTGVIDILKIMGANIELLNKKEVGGEPVADIRVKHAKLKGIQIPENLVSLAIDEFPSIFIAAACAEGVTTLSNAEELRVKETDRIAVMAEGLDVLGIENKVHADGISIVGGALSGGEVDSQGDHRIAMAFSIASLKSSTDIIIKDCANVATSFPNFVALANKVGLQIAVQTN
jgi:3-phosphoshikimate 1-carboxyvinyltransferase